MRRVVVTGLGMVTPLGCGVEPTWTRILAGNSGAKSKGTELIGTLSVHFLVEDARTQNPAS